MTSKRTQSGVSMAARVARAGCFLSEHVRELNDEGYSQEPWLNVEVSAPAPGHLRAKTQHYSAQVSQWGKHGYLTQEESQRTAVG